MAQAHAILADDVGEAQLGWILAHQVRDRSGKRLFRKGMAIDADALARWNEAERGELHLIEPAPDDLHEDEAGRRVAQAVGQGLRPGALLGAVAALDGVPARCVGGERALGLRLRLGDRPHVEVGEMDAEQRRRVHERHVGRHAGA